MADLIDPIESGFNSLVAPLTSIFPDPASPAAVTPVSPASNTAPSPDAFSIEGSDTTTQSALTTSSSRTKNDSTSRTKDGSTSSQTSVDIGITSVTISSSTSSSTLSLTAAPTTFTTSTSSSAGTSTPAAPNATSNPVAANSPNLENQHSASGNSVSTVGIVIASVFAALVIIAALWLTFRFCPPIRRRYDIWKYQRQKLRSYREAIDGPAVPQKDVDPAITREVVRNQTQRPFSFLGGHTPQQLVNDQARTVTQPHDTGLGLGRVSMLRNHSLLRRAGHEVPRDAKSAALPKLQTGQPQRQQPPQEAHWYRGSQARRPPPLQLQQRPRNYPTGPVERISQIGLAVSSTPVSATHPNINAYR